MQNSNDKILDYIIKELNKYKITYKDNLKESVQEISIALEILKEEMYKIPNELQEDLVEFHPPFIYDLHEPSIDCQYLYFKITGELHCKNISFAPLTLQKKIISSDVHFIKYIKNPSEELQKIAVERDITTIQHIKKPTKNIQKYVIDKDIFGLGYIQNSSKEIQMYAIGKDWKAIYYIQNPSKKIRVFAKQEFIKYGLNNN